MEKDKSKSKEIDKKVYTRIEQFQECILNGNVKEIQNILDNDDSDFDINCTDQNGLSSLFLALSHGHARKNPEMISLLLSEGAVIKNGNTPQPGKLPKLLTQYANAQNIHNIFKTFHA